MNKNIKSAIGAIGASLLVGLKRSSIVAFSVLVGIVGQTSAPFFSTAHAAPPAAPPTAVEVQSFGASYGEWSAQWWQWLLSIPAATSPNFGGDCAQGQYGNVWFLGGAFGVDSNIRACTVPAGKALFFPLVNGIAAKPLGSETLMDLRQLVSDSMDSESILNCTIDDGKKTVKCAPDLFTHRATSPSFTVIAPPKGVLPPGWLSVPGNTDPLVSDGYWILLPPLEPGNYGIDFGGTIGDSFDVEVSYDLTVE